MSLHYFLDALHDSDSKLGYSGLALKYSSTLFANFSLIMGSLTALGGLILVGYNIAIKVKEYNIKKIELKKLEDNE